MNLIAGKPITVNSVTDALFTAKHNPVQVWDALVEEIGLAEASAIWLTIFSAQDASET